MKRSDLYKSLKEIKKEINSSHDSTLKNVINDLSEKNHKVCTCKDSSGEVKTLYTHRKEAEKVASLRQENLRIYPCPYENGWHLTSI